MPTSNRIRLFLLPAATAVLAAFGCFNPFFPETGEPINVAAARSTPAGTVQQLFTAYETRQINLFMDLFSPTKDFRFYVSPSFQLDYQKERAGAPLETIDSMFNEVRRVKGYSQMNYWTYDDEIEIHNNLFTQATDITMDVSPQPIDTNTIDYFSSATGTQYAEVIVRGGRFKITVINAADQTAIYYYVDIGEQAFYLEHDPQNATLWVIAKWFDLGTASSDASGQ
jgi:hypothetical protein